MGWIIAKTIPSLSKKWWKSVCNGIQKKGTYIHNNFLSNGVIYTNIRLSATELLKLPFFKKAKSKEFIRDVVLGDAPNLQSRAKQVIMYVN